MKTLGLVLLLTALSFGQSATGSISGFYMVISADTLKMLNVPGFVDDAGKDMLQVLLSSSRADVNQYTVTVSYECGGTQLAQSTIIGRNDPYYSLAVFKVPLRISNIKVTVAAAWVEVKETKTF